MLRLDQKLQKIRDGRYAPGDFIIADAKDSDMGSGVTGTGFLRNADGTQGRRRTRQEFLQAIEEIVRQDVVDIMLVSVSNLDELHARGAFDGSAVKPAIRANETTDCWGGVRHETYVCRPSHPFRTAHLPQVRYGSEVPQPGAPVKGTDLGLYSVTFNNDFDADIRSLEAFADFRRDAAANEFKYFYEVFNPNVPLDLDRDALGEYMNDCILRSLAGVSKANRPEFLKIVYNGPKALEELASFDSTLVVGVLGGGAGTARDTFELVAQAEKYGARVALFGRKINLAESPLAMIATMRHVADGALAPEEAVRAYHGELQKAGLVPARSLEDDRTITEANLKPASSLRAA
ncbi:hypothetical protein [Aureimonas sp. ME7]|uniref:hypothetical protein n=1 Tax=Aureimonas sp. ME7 TaxID=2744252 RepID=UPI0015F5D1A6|nr:hypothetical protein [Aureimonas sp. ME7]